MYQPSVPPTPLLETGPETLTAGREIRTPVVASVTLPVIRPVACATTGPGTVRNSTTNEKRMDASSAERTTSATQSRLIGRTLEPRPHRG